MPGLLGNSGNVAMDVIIAAAAFGPFPILAVVCWIFWRAKRREDAERPGEDGASPGRREAL